LKVQKKLILDFNEKFKLSFPGNDIIVLSSTYENQWTQDVRKFRSKKDLNVDEYTVSWDNLIQQVSRRKEMLKAYEYPFFNLVVSPLSRWLEAIDYCFDNFDIENVEFSSFSNNKKISIFEAEGEINSEILYKKWYYLSKYISEYLKIKYKIGIKGNAEKGSITPVFSYYLRNLIFFLFIIGKQILFKCITFKRVYTSLTNEEYFMISSRAIVQSDFIINFLKKERKAILIANEQSNRLFKHKKFLKKNHFDFIYAEGNIKVFQFIQLLREFLRNNVFLPNKERLGFTYQGIEFSFDNFYLELGIRELDYIFYALSVKNTIEKHFGSLPKKLISFEMFTPYPFYLKRINGIPTFQIQTTLLERLYVPNFIGGDKFLFTNPQTYNEFVRLNPRMKAKFGCLPFFKYIGKERKSMASNSSLHSLTYFTQPIDLHEELRLIEFLEKYCLENKIQFTLKPHPRQLQDFKTKAACTIVADQYSSVEKLIYDSDLIITRTSSVGLDAWIYGVPSIFVKLNENAQQLDIFFAPTNYLGTCLTFDALKYALDNYHELLLNFKDHPLYETTNVKQFDLKDLYDNV
jgi:ribosomal protein S18